MGQTALHCRAMNPGFDRARLALLLLLVALLGVGLWAYRGVGDSLREIRGTGLRTLLNTQVGTLELWLHHKQSERRWKLDFNLRAGE